MSGYCPHYVMLLVSATAGVVGMTQEHLGIAVALEVPFFIVVTKVGEVPLPSASVHCRYRYRIKDSLGSI